MQCVKCGCYRCVRDFYHNSDECYKCMYRRKLRISKGLTRVCLNCGVDVDGQRKYCCDACRKAKYWFCKLSKNSHENPIDFGGSFACPKM